MKKVVGFVFALICLITSCKVETDNINDSADIKKIDNFFTFEQIKEALDCNHGKDEIVLQNDSVTLGSGYWYTARYNSKASGYWKCFSSKLTGTISEYSYCGNNIYNLTYTINSDFYAWLEDRYNNHNYSRKMIKGIIQIPVKYYNDKGFRVYGYAEFRMYPEQEIPDFRPDELIFKF